MSSIDSIQLGSGLLVHTYKVTGAEVIEILDDNKEDVMNEYEQEDVLVQVKPDQMVGATAELASNTRRSGQTKIENRQSEDYELYTTLELMLAAPVEEKPAGDEEDDEVLATLAHFIMVHYEENEQ
jgi:hypothetical protein